MGICKQCAVACIFGFLKQQLYNIDVLLQVSQSASDSILYHLGLPLPSAGFHVFPTFLMSEFTTICSATISVVILKLFIGVCVLGFFTGHCKSSTWGVAFSLAQVSEFSFVLASRARQLRIISREVCQSIILLALLMTITTLFHLPIPHQVYLVILSIAAMSLLLAPVLWRTFQLQSPLRRGSLSFLYRTLSKLPRNLTFKFKNSGCAKQKPPPL